MMSLRRIRLALYAAMLMMSCTATGPGLAPRVIPGVTVIGEPPPDGESLIGYLRGDSVFSRPLRTFDGVSRRTGIGPVGILDSVFVMSWYRSAIPAVGDTVTRVFVIARYRSPTRFRLENIYQRGADRGWAYPATSSHHPLPWEVLDYIPSIQFVYRFLYNWHPCFGAGTIARDDGYFHPTLGDDCADKPDALFLGTVISTTVNKDSWNELFHADPFVLERGQSRR